MKAEQIFIGDIKKCTKYEAHTTLQCETYINGQSIGGEGFGYVKIEDEIFKENAILIKFENGGYVNVENINSILDYIKIYKNIKKNGYKLGGLMMSTYAHRPDCLFVDRDSITRYCNGEQTKNISIHQLRKQIKNSKSK